MDKRQRKLIAVFNLAKRLAFRGQTMTFDDLAVWLNRQGFATGYGTAYQGGRGVARLVTAAYSFVRNELRLGDLGAAPVAKAFTNAQGEYAYQ